VHYATLGPKTTTTTTTTTTKQTSNFMRTLFNGFIQIIIFVALFAMVACVFANEYGHYPQYHTEEKKFISLPALKLKLGSDKLTFKLPNLMTLFQNHQEHHYPQHY